MSNSENNINQQKTPSSPNKCEIQKRSNRIAVTKDERIIPVVDSNSNEHWNCGEIKALILK